MQNAEWSKIKDIFYQTLDLPSEQREKFLANQAESIRSEVLELIASHEKAENFISEPAVVEFGLNTDNLIGKQIGDYKIIKEIGTGGMGKVYLAEREGFEQKFALKLIKRGMDTEAVLQRFVRERQILSRLEHPNIARLLNVGSTDEGLPFFVMEYVEGLPVTNFCQNNKLSIDEKLRIFQQICQAVSYAHQNLVVHRDLKPSNILVTEDGTPKLLDFGIAKLLNSDSFENTATAFQARMFTPEYASPEQLEGLAITTSTDIYSLGVILHELLSGQRPSKVISGRWSGNKKTNKNKDETNFVENNSRITFSKISNADLENITKKALRKESERRYNSVQEFSEDIRRYLNGLPVTATADTSFYRLNKFIGRHKLGTAVAALIIILSGISVWQAIVANRERAKAEKRFEQVRKLANTVLFEYHDGIAQLPGATAMREKMVKDSLEFLDNLSTESVDNLDLQRDIAKAYKKVGDIQGASDTGNIGKTTEALQSYQKAISIQEQIVKTKPESIEDKITLGGLYNDFGLLSRNKGNLEGSETIFTNALNIFTELQNQSANNINVLSGMAKTYWNFGSLQTARNNIDGSLENYAKAVEIYEKLAVIDPSNPRFSRNVALTNKNIGSVLQLRGENEKAMTHFQKSLAIDLENVGKRPNDVSTQLDLSFTYGTIASALRGMKDFQGSRENYNKAIEIREKIFKADPKNVFAENALARAYQDLGRTFLAEEKFTEAEENLIQAQQIYQKMADSDAENLTKKQNLAENLALLAYSIGLGKNIEKANSLFSQSFEIYSELLKQEKLTALWQRFFASAYLDYSEILLKNNQPVKAQENLQKAQTLLENEAVKNDAKEELAKLLRLQGELAKK